MKKDIVILWYKKDLRIRDHQPLCAAIQSGLPVLAIHLTEPELEQYPDSSKRHWNFTYESITDINKQLHHTFIYSFKASAEAIFTQLAKHYNIKAVYSHQEIGNKISYLRDLQMAKWFLANHIRWVEYPTNGIIRGLKHRNNYQQHWHRVMDAPLQMPDLKQLQIIQPHSEILSSCAHMDSYECAHRQNLMQPGGESAAHSYLKSFLDSRHTTYMRHISKPEASRTSCSRISPYLTYGNVSMRQVYQETMAAKNNAVSRRSLHAFISRLHWHDHFIQKFESHCAMEFDNVNPGYNGTRTETNGAWLEAWKQGQTGFPLIDATMRCLHATGYINFRMRSMLVSFLTHHLWQPWQSGVHHLARLFLDYEPGIHYPQFQMQAATFGVHTIRIYNPEKQALEQDPDGTFIKKWLPELANCPTSFIHNPYALSALERRLITDPAFHEYPLPIINLTERARMAREQLWKLKGSKLVRANTGKILRRLSNPG